MNNNNKKAQSYTQHSYASQSNAKTRSHYKRGKGDCTKLDYFTNWPREKYLEYYWELIDFLRLTADVSYDDDYCFQLHYEDSIDGYSDLFKMQIYKDDSVSFNYCNQCVDHVQIRLKLKDVFKAFKTRSEALKFMQICMNCFSVAAKGGTV